VVKYSYTKYFCAILFFVAFLFLPPQKLFSNITGVMPNSPKASQKDEGNENTLKSVYLYNFTRYIDWKKTTNNKFVILVIGDSTIMPALNVIAQSRVVDGMQIVIKKEASNIDVNNCNMIYIPASQNDKLRTILLQMDKNTNTLVVSEVHGDAVQGADINFVLEDNMLRFEINNFSLKKHGLKASSQLLKLAVNVFE